MKKHCKPSLKPIRSPDIFLMSNVITAREADAFRVAMLNSPKTVSKVRRGSIDSYHPFYRRSHTVAVGKDYFKRAVGIFQSLRPKFEEHFCQRLGACQTPQFLLYGRGHFFQRHLDTFNNKKQSKDRLITVVLFLNSFCEIQGLPNNPMNNRYYFSGGKLLLDAKQTLKKELTSSEKRREILGKTGQVVAFMAGTMHEVTPIKNGMRFTIVTWFETP